MTGQACSYNIDNIVQIPAYTVLGVRNFSRGIAINKSVYSRVRTGGRMCENTDKYGKERVSRAEECACEIRRRPIITPEKDRCGTLFPATSCAEASPSSATRELWTTSQKITPIKDTHVPLNLRIYLALCASYAYECPKKTTKVSFLALKASTNFVSVRKLLIRVFELNADVRGRKTLNKESWIRRDCS